MDTYATCPYNQTQPHQKWKHPGDVNRFLLQVQRPRFLSKADVIASAGSCFAQNIGRHLVHEGFSYLVAETPPPFVSAEQARAMNYGVFSCRYGNIYTILQLQQLIERACGTRTVEDQFWQDDKGRWFDLLRPRIQPRGFASEEEAREDAKYHLQSVSSMFAASSVFIFTYGLTEYWYAKSDGTVFPTAPGCGYGRFEADKHAFGNMTVADVTAATTFCIDAIRKINPGIRFIFTVSPVPLLATYTSTNVVEASTYSKSVLRVAVEECRNRFKDCYYFPSYEIVQQYCTEPVWDASGRNPSEQSLKTVFRNFHYQFVAEHDEVPVNDRAAKASSSALAPAGNVCDEEEIYLALASKAS